MNCPDCHCPRGEPLTVAANSLVTRCHNAFHAVDARATLGEVPCVDCGATWVPMVWSLGVVTCADASACRARAGSASPARPDDFATETAKGTTPPHPTHHGAAEALVCLVCGKAECSHGEAKVVVCTGCGSSDGGHPLDCPTRVEFPYTTPIPTAHDGSTGFRFCNACDTVVDVADHECETALPRGECWTVGCRNLSEYEATGHGAANFCAACTAADRGEAFGWVKKPWGHRETMAAKEFAESLLCAMAFDSARSNPEFGCNVGLFRHDEDECVMCFEFYGRRAARGGGR